MDVLLVEDDALLGAGLRAALQKSGFVVTWIKDGVVALDLLGTQEFVAMILDLGLPKISGADVIRTLRSKGNAIPILVLTAADSVRSKVSCLEIGADDFLTKTVEMEELVARLRALVRRSGHHNGVMQSGSLRLDLEKHTLTKNGSPVRVSKIEFSALRALMDAAGKVLTRAQLEQSMYGWKSQVDSNAVEVHIHNLRAKIGPGALQTVRGIGYTLAATHEE